MDRIEDKCNTGETVYLDEAGKPGNRGRVPISPAGNEENEGDGNPPPIEKGGNKK